MPEPPRDIAIGVDPIPPPLRLALPALRHVFPRVIRAGRTTGREDRTNPDAARRPSIRIDPGQAIGAMA